LIFFTLVVTPETTWMTGIINLCLATGAGAILKFSEPLKDSIRRLMLAAIMLSIFLFAMPFWFSPEPPNDFGGTTPTDALNNYEQRGFGIAVLPPGDPIPSTLTN